MTGIEHGTRMCYQAGCRLEQCKEAESSYKRDLRRRKREAVGESAPPPVTALSLVSDSGTVPSTSGNTGLGAVSAVMKAIEALGDHQRPDLEAGALAMAAILDNPKAISTQPAAMAKMVDVMGQLRKSGDTKKSKLASIRSMTSGNSKTG